MENPVFSPAHSLMLLWAVSGAQNTLWETPSVSREDFVTRREDVVTRREDVTLCPFHCSQLTRSQCGQWEEGTETTSSVVMLPIVKSVSGIDAAFLNLMAPFRAAPGHSHGGAVTPGHRVTVGLPLPGKGSWWWCHSGHGK